MALRLPVTLHLIDNLRPIKAFFTRVTACHVATYYYVGFCYLALRRYSDSVRTFSTILNFISRMRQYHTKSYQYDQVSKRHSRFSQTLTGAPCRSTKRAIGCTRCWRCASASRRAG